MTFIADILLVAGALGAGFYCYILARRLSRFNDLENGVGGAVAVLSAQVDDLSRSLASARASSEHSTETLGGLTTRAEGVAQRLELLVASMHDLPAEMGSPNVAQQEPSAEPMFIRHPTPEQEAS
ncbi:MAG: hypothetical protein JXR13_16100 [Thalassovita sp.]